MLWVNQTSAWPNSELMLSTQRRVFVRLDIFRRRRRRASRCYRQTFTAHLLGLKSPGVPWFAGWETNGGHHLTKLAARELGLAQLHGARGARGAHAVHGKDVLGQIDVNVDNGYNSSPYQVS